MRDSKVLEIKKMSESRSFVTETYAICEWTQVPVGRRREAGQECWADSREPWKAGEE